MKPEEKNPDENLNVFEGWDETEELDVFTQLNPEQEKEVIEKPDKKGNKEEKPKASTPEEIQAEEEQVAEKLFEEFSEEVDEETDEEEEDAEKADKETEDSTPEIATVKFLKEKGLLDFELEEGEELTKEMAEELIEASYADALEERISEVFKSVPQYVKDIFELSAKGGDVDGYLQKLTSGHATGITENLDLTSEANQISIIKTQLLKEGWDNDYIDTQIEYLKDSDNLEKVSKKHFEKWKKDNQAEKEAIMQRAKVAEEAEREGRRKMKSKVEELLTKEEELLGLKISKSDAKTIPSYMSDKTVKLQNGSYVTAMQRDLYTALQDEKKAVVLAKLLKDDLSFSDIIKNLETKVVSKTEDTLKGSNKAIKTRKVNSQSKPKQLADYFKN